MKRSMIISAFKKLFGIAEKTTKQNSTSEEPEPKDEKQLVKLEEIPDTPFTAARYEGKWYLMIGRYRLTEGLKTKKAVLKEAENTSWWRLMAVMKIVAEMEIDMRSKEVIANGLDETIKRQQEEMLDRVATNKNHQ